MVSAQKIPCSVGMLTFNSARTLRKALDSVSFCDDIVLCDGGSTDETHAIAQEYGCRVISQEANLKNAEGKLIDFGGARNQVLAAARHDWFLYIDSDETISGGLAEDIEKIVTAPLKGGDPLVYCVPIRIIMDGKEIKHSSNYPGYQHRFFNRTSGAQFIKPVHERISFDVARVTVGVLHHPWYVYATMDDARHYLRNTAGYRKLERKLFEKYNFFEYVKFTLMRNLRTSLGAFLKSSWNYLRYGFEESSPICEEFGRMMAPLLTIYGTTVAILRYRFDNKDKNAGT